MPHLSDETRIHASAAPFTGYIATGSTKHSIAKFWASVGVLQPSAGGYKDLVLTSKQLEVAQFDWQNVDLDIKGRNFAKIRVTKQQT